MNGGRLVGLSRWEAPEAFAAALPGILGSGGRDPAWSAQPDPGAVAAQATVTVTAGSVRCFAETSRCVGGPLRAYWEAHGRDLGDPGVSYREPLAAFGYPLSEEFEGQLEAGAAHRVQYFERARFEYHPDDRAPCEVLLGQPGRRILAGSRGR